ncbi:MAG: hypothetical protein JSS91_00805 [Bacteroidetes bacterium]|nr:hypothetical protein [Bacteroidota bacterium]
MDEKSQIAPEEEAKTTEPAKTEAAPEPKATPEAKKDVTVSEALETKEAEPKKAGPRVVPEATFLEVKKELKELRQAIKDGATKSEVSADLKSIADKYNLDENFVTDLASVIQSNSKAKLDEELSSKLKPIQEKERAEKIDKAFTEHFSKAMESMPEYEGVVNKDVIKSLSLDPINANKTFVQIIEESYGHLVTGKRTIDHNSPQAGRSDNTEVDYDRAKKEPKYYSEIMANPVLKKKYNEGLTDRLQSAL